ncbi:hypothetical protein H2204_002075 [Knufia peltigerae]|uniref:DUF218 domain-containing protein n=1 Tax=Knufia peltigerae TaxID=1002370 RepID=A0AA39D1U4_9EURO|nr:hypothetical protein H2204_002075 [Knufia peltigerae]
MSYEVMEEHNSIDDVNLLAEYLASPRVSEFSSCTDVDAVVICASEVLAQAESIFETLSRHPSITKTLVLCGGKGHSTGLIYEAVAKHQRFHALATEIEGLPEAAVLEQIMFRYFDVAAITSHGCKILLEDMSTNCGANAANSRRVLEAAGVCSPRRIVVVQDPTMAKRTVASFQRAYEDVQGPPEFLNHPVFVPRMDTRTPEQPQFCIAGLPSMALWAPGRFLDLIMGEIPRIRDNESGYGPRGRNFLPHIDVPAEVEEAWGRLSNVLEFRR